MDGFVTVVDLASQIKIGVGRALGFVAHQQRPFKVNLVRASIQNFFIYLTMQYQSIYILALGASPLQLGFINGIGGLAAAGIATPTGWLTSRYGIRQMFIVGAPLMALGALLFATAPDWIWLIPATFVASLALRWMITACSMVCGGYLKSQERATGMQLCDTISAVPRLASPLLAAVMITQFGGLNANGIRPLYYLQIAGMAAILILVLFRFEDPLRNSRARSEGFLEGIRLVFQKGTKVKSWILYIFMSTTSMFMSSTYISVYAAQVKAADQFVIGGMATASVVLPLILSLATGRLADTVGRRKVISIMVPLNALSFVVLLLAQNPLWILASGMLQGFSMLVFITENAVSAELVPFQIMGSWFGLLGLFRGLASVAGPLVGGVIWSALGPNLVMISLVAIEASKIAILLTIPETLNKQIDI